jgi:hypothetical protein
MSPLNDPGFAQTNPGYVDRDPGFSKTPKPGYVDRDPGFTKPFKPSQVKPKYTPMPNPTPPGGYNGKPKFTPMPKATSKPGQKLGPSNPSWSNLSSLSSPADRSNNSNRVPTVIGKVGDYLGNIGQNVRDVGTAAGTNIQIARNESVTKSSPLNKAGTSNFINQAKEVAGSLIGRPGTRSDQYKP